MADAHLSQQILLLVHAGANFLLPDHPLTWQAREPMSKEYTDGLGHLLGLTQMHYPEQVGPVSDYIRRWVNGPRTPPSSPPGFSILKHTYATVAHATLSFRDAMQVAAQYNARGVKVVQLRRGQNRKSLMAVFRNCHS